SLRPGDRVVLSWAPSCGKCRDCARGRPAACVPLHRAIAAGTLVDGRTGMSLIGETVYRGTATGALAERLVVAERVALPLGDDVARAAARGGRLRLRRRRQSGDDGARAALDAQRRNVRGGGAPRRRSEIRPRPGRVQPPREVVDRDDVRIRGPGRRAADPARARGRRKVAAPTAPRADVPARRRERRDRGEPRRLGRPRGRAALTEQVERTRWAWRSRGGR